MRIRIGDWGLGTDERVGDRDFGLKIVHHGFGLGIWIGIGNWRMGCMLEARIRHLDLGWDRRLKFRIWNGSSV